MSTQNKLGLVDIVKDVLFGFVFKDSTIMGGALWFLKILFFVSILYCVFDYIIAKFVHKQILACFFQGVISIVLLAFGFFFLQNLLASSELIELHLHIGFMRLDMDFADFAVYIKIGFGNNICC